MNPSSQAQDVVRAGRGALFGALFGAGWLGWGLGQAKAFNGFTAPTFGFTALFLLVCSIYAVRKGRQLRKKYPAAGATARQTVLKWFLLVVLIEFLTIGLLTTLAYRLHRPNLATVWCAMIVGLHFLPLAKIFRAPHLNVLGVLIVLWCALCWALFRSDTLAISASLGTGVLFWARCVLSLLRAWRMARSLRIQ